ncbi:efflux RND transporter periplasmic adaptor subunit [Mesorhizobium sp. RP14(2022)]|uniref:Efflux RND transporter periplasmic adaptor subunit n=1 Tax=Mesorhizobium liriopis TaxID=2953882 RepID=A0ABT1C475_9HYPH|nr:efflux RND transporter periplasmic adaptor subunit [Mesorhizobium liriopis]MCO6049630.1 efflux RND transporter periplasmic adaptor subunit [Mesorhizobium liriopis]
MTRIALLPVFASLLASSTAAWAEETVFDCLAEPAQRVQVGSPVVGLLSSVEVGRGALVEKGAVLARLDSKVEEANLAMARAQAEATEARDAQQTRLTLAQASLDRSKKLEGSGNVTRSKLEELQATVDIAKRDLDTEERKLRLAAIEVERQQALLARQSIVSPLRGFVAEQNLRAGEFVRQDSAILTLVQTDPLFIEAYMPVSLWGKITAGAQGRVAVEQPAGTVREASVTVVDRVFDAASGTFGIRLELPNPDNAIPAGQRCRLSFDLAAEVAQTR